MSCSNSIRKAESKLSNIILEWSSNLMDLKALKGKTDLKQMDF